MVYGITLAIRPHGTEIAGQIDVVLADGHI